MMWTAKFYPPEPVDDVFYAYIPITVEAISREDAMKVARAIENRGHLGSFTDILEAGS